MRHGWGGPWTFAMMSPVRPSASDEPLLAIDDAPVRELIAAGVMEVPQNAGCLKLAAQPGIFGRSPPAPKLVAIVGIHDG